MKGYNDFNSKEDFVYNIIFCKSVTNYTLQLYGIRVI